MLIALFPLGIPWFSNDPTPEMEILLPPEEFEVWDGILFSHELQIKTQLEHTKYRTAMEQVVRATLGVGSGLASMDDEFKFRGYRWDQFVQRRRHSGEWQWLMTRVELLPEEITPEMMEKSGITPQDIESKMSSAFSNVQNNNTTPHRGERTDTFSFYTRCSRQMDDTFVVESELNDKPFKSFDTKTSPFFLVGFDEVPGDDYPQSFVDRILASLRSANGLTKGILEGTAMSVKYIPVVDTTKNHRVSDIGQPNGTAVTGDVVGGIPQGIGFVQTNKAPDLSVAANVVVKKETEIAQHFLMEQGAQRQAERVTAEEVQRVSGELSEALGEPYLRINTDIQEPLILRVQDIMQKKLLLTPIPEGVRDGAKFNVLTGIEALGKQRVAQRLNNLLGVLSQIPEAAQRIKWDNVLETAFQAAALEKNKFVLTEEELQQKIEAARQAAIEAQGQQQLISTAGKVTENAAQAAQ